MKWSLITVDQIMCYITWESNQNVASSDFYHNLPSQILYLMPRPQSPVQVAVWPAVVPGAVSLQSARSGRCIAASSLTPHCTALHCATLYSTALWYTALHWTSLHSKLYRHELHGCSISLHCILLKCTKLKHTADRAPHCIKLWPDFSTLQLYRPDTMASPATAPGLTLIAGGWGNILW